MRWVPVLLVLTGLMNAHPARAQIAKGLFDTLHGQELRRVRATLSTDDDVEFARKLLIEAKTSVPQRELLIDLCNNAYDLSWSEPAGQPTAIEAMKLLAQQVPDKASLCNRKLLSVYRERYPKVADEEKKQLAQAWGEAARLVGRDMIDGGLWTDAATLYEQASVVVNEQGLTALARVIDQEAERAKQRALAADRIRKLRYKVKNYPDAPDTLDAKHELVHLYVSVMNDPVSAAEYLDTQTDPAYADMVTLAGHTRDARDAGEWYDLARWYQRLALGAHVSLQEELLDQAKRYYAQFVSGQEVLDLRRAKAVLALRRIDGGEGLINVSGGALTTVPLRSAEAPPTPAPPTPTPPTPPTPTPTPTPPTTPTKTDPANTGANTPATVPTPTPPTTPTPTPPVVDPAVAKWVDLIPLIDAEKDGVFGTWKLDNGKLVLAEKAESARLRLPVTTGSSYRMRVTFKRTDGSSTIAIILPVGDRSVRLMLSGFGGLVSGLGMIDGKLASENATKVTPGAIENDRVYTVLADVSITDGQATIQISLDDKPYIQWTGDPASLEVQSAWKLKTTTGAPNPGLGAHLSTIEYTAIELQVVEGTMTKLRP